MQYLFRTLLLAASMLMMMGLIGCAQPGNYQRMALSQHEIQTFKEQCPKNSCLKNNLALETVQGGKKTNPMWTSQVDAKSFQQALTASLTNAALSSKDNDKARYLLTANLLRLEQPIFGFNFTVTSHVNYKLLDTRNNKVLFEKTLVTPYTAKLTETFYGPERLKVANEGAIKENIKALVSSLYEI